MSESNIVYGLLEEEDKISIVRIAAKPLVNELARHNSVPVTDAWKMLRKYTYSKFRMALSLKDITIPPKDYLLISPTLAATCKAFVESEVEA